MKFDRTLARHAPQPLLCCAVILLIVATQLPASAQVFRKHPRLFPVGPNPAAIAAGDLTDNGYPDLVTADRGEFSDLREQRPANDEISLLKATGDGNYERHSPNLKTGFGPYAIAIANIDALRWPDIIVVNFLAVRQRDIHLFLNLKPEGIFNATPFQIPDEGLQYKRHRDGDDNPVFTVPGLTSLVLDHFNRDSYRDIVATGWSSDTLVFVPGHPELHFDVDNSNLIDAPGGPVHVAAADFDGDGVLDLAVAMESSGEVTLWKGDGRGDFVEQKRFLSRGRLPNRVRIGDVNRDGILDVVVSHRYTEDSLVIFYGDGNWNFSVTQEIALGRDPQVQEFEIRDFVLEDLTGNGRLDIAAACFAAGNVVVLINEATGNERQQRFRRETHSFDGGRPRALCAADINQNGKKDLAVALWGVNAVGLLMQR